MSRRIFAVDARRTGARRATPPRRRVEYYWTLVAVHARDAAGDVIDMNREISYGIAVQASRLAGTPEAVLPKPPPYATKSEAIEGLEELAAALPGGGRVVDARDLQKRLTVPWGTVSVRWAVEHIVEHDWDHAVQLDSAATLTSPSSLTPSSKSPPLKSHSLRLTGRRPGLRSGAGASVVKRRRTRTRLSRAMRASSRRKSRRRASPKAL